MKRVNMNFDENLLERVDAYAKRMGINRSAAIAVLTSQALDGQEGIAALNRLAEMVKEQESEKAE